MLSSALTMFIAAAAVGMFTTKVGEVFACLFLAFTVKLAVDVRSMMSPKKFVDLSTAPARHAFSIVKNGGPAVWPLEQEVRPIQDAILHVVLFQWQIFGTRSRILGRILTALNADFDCWDLSFEERGKDAKTEVLSYCRRYGVPEKPWPWSKRPEDYITMNEWFSRSYKDGIIDVLDSGGTQNVVSAPATAVVTTYPSVALMPSLVKNEQFSIEGVLPEPQQYRAHPCTIHYLSPADYHCFHSPMTGRIIALDLKQKEAAHSVTVKNYVFRYINILKRNRRVVLVLEGPGGFRCAMVIIGGITVDSIRLDAGIKVGQHIQRGQRVGAFARGGSSIALFFSRPVVFCYPGYGKLAGSGIDCKLGNLISHRVPL